VTDNELHALLAIVGAAGVVTLIAIVVWQWLTYERERRMARLHWERPRQPSPLEDTRQVRALQDQVDGLTRENRLIHRRYLEVCKSLDAARRLYRVQERAQMALTTVRVERDQTDQLETVPPELALVAPIRDDVRVSA
jgi:hypothetical protein